MHTLTQHVRLNMEQFLDHRAVTNWMNLWFLKMLNFLHVDGCLTKDKEISLQQLHVVGIVYNFEYDGVGKDWFQLLSNQIIQRVDIYRVVFGGGGYLNQAYHR